MYLKRLLAAIALVTVTQAHADSARPYNCLTSKVGCEIVIRIPEGQPDQIVEYQACKPECDPTILIHPFLPACYKTCDTRDRRGWVTDYVIPPAGEVCTFKNAIGAVMEDIERKYPGWVWARIGCTSRRIADM